MGRTPTPFAGRNWLTEDFNMNTQTHTWMYTQNSIYSPLSFFLLSLSFFFFFSVFLGPHPRHMEVPRLGIKLELQPLATAMPDPSFVCDLHHSLWQYRSLTYWARPGIEPASSGILVIFVSTEPWWELLSFWLTAFWMVWSSSSSYLIRCLWDEVSTSRRNQTVLELKHRQHM